MNAEPTRIAFTLFLIFEYEAKSQVKRQLSGISEIPQSSSTLISYLRTPVIVDGAEANMADLIRLWYIEPSKYENLLKTSTKNIIDRLEYEYEHPKTKKFVTRGFEISINKQKFSDRAVNHLLSFASKSFDENTCISDEYGCINLGEQFIPVSYDKNPYIVLRESFAAK